MTKTTYPLFSIMFFSTISLMATPTPSLYDRLIEYPLQAAINGTQDDYIFYLFEQNIINLDNIGTSNSATNELLSLLDEGYVIDSSNMAKLIELLDRANPSTNAIKVIFKAIEYQSPFTADNITSLIMLLDHVNPSKIVTKILIKAIESNIPLNEKHLAYLITLLTRANPSNSATTILLKAIECKVKFSPKERFLLAVASKIANARSNVEKIRKALHDRENKD